MSSEPTERDVEATWHHRCTCGIADAERIAQARREGAAEALVDAADDPTLQVFPRIAAWLRARAAALRGDE